MLNFDFLEKSLRIVLPPLCMIFQEKCFSCYALPNFLEIMENMLSQMFVNDVATS